MMMTPGDCEIRGDLSLADHVLLVIDPRSSRCLLLTMDPDRMDDAAGGDPGAHAGENSLRELIESGQLPACRVTIFMLVHTTTSCPYSMLHAEVGLQNMGVVMDIARVIKQQQPHPDPTHKLLPVDWLRLIRMDDWAVHGDAILGAMMEQGN